MITSILSGLLFFLFPILIGRSALRLFGKSKIALPFVSYFISGSFIVYLSTLFVYYIGQLVKIPIGFELLFPVTIGLLSFIFIPANAVIRKFDLNIKKYLLPALASIGIAALTTLLWRIQSPLPLNWDMHEHQTLVNTMLQGKFSFFSSQVTDTFGFNGYSTLFHTLISASQVFFNISVFDYWNWVSFIHLSLVILGSYLLAEKISGSRVIGFLSMLLGGLIFDSTISFTNLFFIPQTFTSVVFLFLFIQLIQSIKKGIVLSYPTVLLGSLFLFLNHYIVGSVAVFFYLGTYLYFRYQSFFKPKIDRRLAIGFGLTLSIIAIIASGFIPLGFINKGEGEAFILSFSDKFDAIRQSYAFLPLFFLPLGIVEIIRRKKELELYILDTTLGLSALILLQLPYVMKFFVLDKFFLGFIMALGMYTILKRIRNFVLFYLSVLLLTFSLLFIFIFNSANWKDILRYKDYKTHVSRNEIAASEFLTREYGSTNTYMVSDPTTQYILEGLSGINTQGGAYMDHPARSKLIEISKESNPENIAQLLFHIDDKLAKHENTRLFVLSGRYFTWQNQGEKNRQDLSFNMWHPADLTLSNLEYINNVLKDTNHFRLVYENPSLVIVEVKK